MRSHRTRVTPDEKLANVLAGLTAEPPGTEFCRRHGIQPPLSYHWWDPLLPELEALCARHPRFGSHRIAALLKRRGPIEMRGAKWLWQIDRTGVWCGQDS